MQNSLKNTIQQQLITVCTKIPITSNKGEYVPKNESKNFTRISEYQNAHE